MCKQDFLSNKKTIDGNRIKALAEHYYITRDMTMYFVLMMAWCKIKDVLSDYEKYISEDAGSGLRVVILGYLAKQFLDKEHHVFVLIDEIDKNNSDLDILALVLQILGQEVILLRGLEKLENYVNVQQAIDRSVNDAKIIDGVIMMTPVCYQSKDDDGWHDNKEALLFFLLVLSNKREQ